MILASVGGAIALVVCFTLCFIAMRNRRTSARPVVVNARRPAPAVYPGATYQNGGVVQQGRPPAGFMQQGQPPATSYVQRPRYSQDVPDVYRPGAAAASVAPIDPFVAAAPVVQTPAPSAPPQEAPTDRTPLISGIDAI